MFAYLTDAKLASVRLVGNYLVSNSLSFLTDLNRKSIQ